MAWWPLYGITKRLTERVDLRTSHDVTPLPGLFRRSLFVYSLDVGNDNALNFEIAALKTAKYNVHRFGISFAATPRHADVLLVLGRPLPALRDALESTLDQPSRPYGVIWIADVEGTHRSADVASPQDVRKLVEKHGGIMICSAASVSGPSEILAILLTAAGRRLR